MNRETATNDIQKVLKDPKWNAMFLQYTLSAYCPENVMAWNSIQKFKSVSDRTRRELLPVIADTYLREGAPLELNIARKAFNNFEDIFSLIQSLKEDVVVEQNLLEMVSPRRRKTIIPIHTDLLDKIERVCELNMIDNFDRFYADNYNQLQQDLGIS